MRHNRHARGFTLVEIISVMIVLGIVASVAGVGILESVKSYRRTIERLELADMADGALRRMARDLRYALPMSTRDTTSGGVYFLETVVSKNGGRYRKGGTEVVAGGTLTTGSADDMFETLAALSEPAGQVVIVGDLVVTQNLASAAATTAGNIYTRGSAAVYCDGAPTSANCNSAVIGAIDRSNTNTTVITFSDAGGRKLADSNNQEFYVLASNPAVTYVCAPGLSADGRTGTGTLKLYYDYSLSLAQPADVSASPLSTGKNSLLLDYVSGCKIDAQPDLGYAYVSVQLRRDGETMSLFYAMQVPKNL